MAKDESCDSRNLPSELIHDICTQVLDIADRARLRAVCKTWKSSIPPSDPWPCLPWLFDCHKHRTGTSIGYYSFFSNKSYMFEFPEQQRESLYFFSLAGGNLLCCKPYHHLGPSLYNPLTGLMITLPPLDDGVDVLGIASNIFEEDMVVISGSRRINAGGDNNMYVASIRPGDEAWTSITLKIPSHCGVCLYHQGLYYINEGNFKRSLITDATGELISLVSTPILPYITDSQHILESDGEILTIFRYYAVKLEHISFGIFRLDNSTGWYRWVEVKGIGDRILFLHGRRDGSGGGGFSLSSSHFPGFKGNCIYFLEDELGYTVCPCRHDLENETTEMLPNYPGDAMSTWFIPKLV